MSPVIQTATPPLPVARPELVGISPARLGRIRPAMEREIAALSPSRGMASLCIWKQLGGATQKAERQCKRMRFSPSPP